MTQNTARNHQNDTEVIFTLDEAAERLKISKWTVNRLIQERKLASIKIGARRLVPLSDIAAFIERERDREVTRDH